MSVMDRLGVIFDPRFWLRGYPISETWDSQVNRILDRLEKGDLRYNISSSHCRLTLGPIEIWIANWAYAYGRNCVGHNSMVKRRTAIRLRKFIRAEVDKELVRKIDRLLN